MEKMPGYSVNALFNMLAEKGTNKFITALSLHAFMLEYCDNSETRLPTVKRMCGLMRRLKINCDSKMVFPEFAKFIRAVNIHNYIQNIDK